MSSENESTVIEAGAAVAATGVGMVIAGPIGALVGAGAAPVLSRVTKSLRDHVSRRAEQVLQPAVEEVDGEEQLSRILSSKPEFGALAVRAVTKAAQTALDEHVRVLGLVLRDAVAGKVECEEAVDLLETTAALDALSVIVLRALRTTSPDEGRDDHWDADIAVRLGVAGGKARAALMKLQITGAATSTGAAFDGGDRWKIEPIGTAVLEYLQQVVENGQPPTPNDAA